VRRACNTKLKALPLPLQEAIVADETSPGGTPPLEQHLNLTKDPDITDREVRKPNAFFMRGDGVDMLLEKGAAPTWTLLRNFKPVPCVTGRARGAPPAAALSDAKASLPEARVLTGTLHAALCGLAVWTVPRPVEDVERTAFAGALVVPPLPAAELPTRGFPPPRSTRPSSPTARPPPLSRPCRRRRRRRHRVASWRGCR
jgi:hypothetical protein